MTGPVHVEGEVVSLDRAGAYHRLRVRAPGVAETAQPGQFLTFAVGGQSTGMMLRRAFSIHRAEPGGAGGGTVTVVLATRGRGTAWLASRRPGDAVDVVGPLGRPFGLPATPAPCVLVGGGYGSAPLFPLAERLRDGGSRVHMVLGAATRDRLFGVDEARRLSASLTVTTDDGSAGRRGWVSDVLPGLLERVGARTVYACGPMGMLRAVSDIATLHGVRAETAVEEAMACGIGVCMTCVLPVVGDDGVTRMTRACTEGPVFPGHRVRWDDMGTVPADTLGAPVPGEH